MSCTAYVALFLIELTKQFSSTRNTDIIYINDLILIQDMVGEQNEYLF